MEPDEEIVLFKSYADPSEMSFEDLRWKGYQKLFKEKNNLRWHSLQIVNFDLQEEVANDLQNEIVSMRKKSFNGNKLSDTNNRR